jgi:hypothetical protein
MTNKLKPCPCCGDETKLIKYYETCDGRGDKMPEIRCKCGLKMTLTSDEFYKLRDDFNYVGGYYSSNKEFWNGMHQRLIDKWNTRKPIDRIVEQLEETAECYKKSYYKHYDDEDSGRWAGMEIAIEIVKGGAE